MKHKQIKQVIEFKSLNWKPKLYEYINIMIDMEYLWLIKRTFLVYLFVDAEDSIDDEKDVVVLIGFEVARTAATAIAE